MSPAEKKQRTGPDVGSHIVGRHRETVTLELSAEESWDLASATCEKVVEYASIEVRKKAAAKEATRQMKELRAEIETNAIAVRSGKVEREVEIEEVYNFAEDVVYLTMATDGRVIGKRRPTADDRQEAMPFGGAA